MPRVTHFRHHRPRMRTRSLHLPQLARRGGRMRLGRTMGLLTLFAGLTTWFATRAAMQREGERQRRQAADMTRWEDDGGATMAGPQTPGASH